MFEEDDRGGDKVDVDVDVDVEQGERDEACGELDWYDW